MEYSCNCFNVFVYPFYLSRSVSVEGFWIFGNSFWLLPLNVVRWDQRNISLGLILPHDCGKAHLMPCEICLPFWMLGTGTGPVCSLGIVPSSSFGWFSLISYFPHVHAEDLRGNLSRYPELSFGAAFFSLALFPVHSCHLDLPRIMAPSLQFRKTAGFHLGLLSQHYGLETLPRR